MPLAAFGSFAHKSEAGESTRNMSSSDVLRPGFVAEQVRALEEKTGKLFDETRRLQLRHQSKSPPRSPARSPPVALKHTVVPQDARRSPPPVDTMPAKRISPPKHGLHFLPVPEALTFSPVATTATEALEAPFTHDASPASADVADDFAAFVLDDDVDAPSVIKLVETVPLDRVVVERPASSVTRAESCPTMQVHLSGRRRRASFPSSASQVVDFDDDGDFAVSEFTDFDKEESVAQAAAAALASPVTAHAGADAGAHADVAAEPSPVDSSGAKEEEESLPSPQRPTTLLAAAKRDLVAETSRQIFSTLGYSPQSVLVLGPSPGAAPPPPQPPQPPAPTAAERSPRMPAPILHEIRKRFAVRVASPLGSAAASSRKVFFPSLSPTAATAAASASKRASSARVVKVSEMPLSDARSRLNKRGSLVERWSRAAAGFLRGGSPDASRSLDDRLAVKESRALSMRGLLLCVKGRLSRSGKSRSATLLRRRVTVKSARARFTMRKKSSSSEERDRPALAPMDLRSTAEATRVVGSGFRRSRASLASRDVLNVIASAVARYKDPETGEWIVEDVDSREMAQPDGASGSDVGGAPKWLAELEAASRPIRWSALSTQEEML